MKNILGLLGASFKTWRSFSMYPGVYSAADASKHLRKVLQPQRVSEWEMRRWIRKELQVRPVSEELQEVEIRNNGLVFYWAGGISGGLAAAVLQEVNPRHPHYYTTPPVHLTPKSLVLDIGACEGLFAMRVLKAREAAKVICFEPSRRSVEYLRKAAERNGVSHGVEIEVCAVGASTQEVYFSESGSPDASRVVAEGDQSAIRVQQVSLDDYCQTKGLDLTTSDLIKVDAEGADVDVLRGAERLIRKRAPQIAVTTYHNPEHARQLLELLRQWQPRYKLRLKGLTLFGDNSVPRPVLLQASCAEPPSVANAVS